MPLPGSSDGGVPRARRRGGPAGPAGRPAAATARRPTGAGFGSLPRSLHQQFTATLTARSTRARRSEKLQRPYFTRSGGSVEPGRRGRQSDRENCREIKAQDGTPCGRDAAVSAQSSDVFCGAEVSAPSLVELEGPRSTSAHASPCRRACISSGVLRQPLRGAS